MIGDSNPELIIDPGHGGSDPGASGNGIIEKLMTLAISLYQYNRFKELGVKVALTRDTDKFIDSTPRANLVANSKAKYCISNHINGATSTTAKGAEIIHSIHNDGKLAKAIVSSVQAAGQVLRTTATFSKEGNKLVVDSKGQAILKNGEKQYGPNGQDYYFMHRQTGSVATNIVEYGFCSNAEDAARLTAKWQALAEAVVKAYCEFVGHRYVAPKGENVVENTTNKSGFTDVPDNHWAASSIKKAATGGEKGIITGVSEGVFDPNGIVTRAQLAVILDRAKLLNK
ncbi:MAG TPA: N-acetylmuramoyl-L-alanine amidase [Candidatus Paenibacillus intestinavium]|nr:N-acetylmuramoyl-L-alanine amidase [Candidatus Paenibacillus intestinavium]